MVSKEMIDDQEVNNAVLVLTAQMIVHPLFAPTAILAALSVAHVILEHQTLSVAVMHSVKETIAVAGSYSVWLRYHERLSKALRKRAKK